MAKDVKASRLAGRFRIDKSVKTPVVDIYCESCFSRDRVVAYEADLVRIRFSRPYFECQNCGTILCGHCVGKNTVCPDCRRRTLFEVTPKSGHDFCETLRGL